MIEKRPTALDLSQPWLMLPSQFAALIGLAGADFGNLADFAALDRQMHRAERGYTVRDGVAIVPLEGLLAKRENILIRIFGGTSTEVAGQDIRAALADPAVKSILLDIDSPGGSVDGTTGLAGIVREAAKRKPVVAIATGTMASAAYWVGSAASRVYVSEPTTVVGSIGVVARHLDISKMEERYGIKTTLIYAGQYKAVGNQHQPLSDNDRAVLQDRIDYFYSLFVEAVAEHRGTSVAAVLDRMADGRVFVGQQAVDAGLVDGFATLPGLVRTYGTSPPTGASVAAGTPQPASELKDLHSIHENFSGKDPMTTIVSSNRNTSNDTSEAALKRRWDSDAELRTEFMHDFAIFSAYERANTKGLVSVHGQQVVQRDR